jgi:hypothetical protein
MVPDENSGPATVPHETPASHSPRVKESGRYTPEQAAHLVEHGSPAYPKGVAILDPRGLTRFAP